MQRIAILGATSRIARDFIAAASQSYILLLYARDLAPVHGIAVAPLADYGKAPHDAVINFIGSGDPAKTADMGETIIGVSDRFDALALDYVRKNPSCRYLFLSSGAVYGGDFSAPVSSQTVIGNLKPDDYYAQAKYNAESRHRALSALPIVDIRIFNYFSRTQPLAARFFITDMLRAIVEKSVFKTTASTMARDYLHPADFYQLVDAVVKSPAANVALDAYSRAPIDKFALLGAMAQQFGLRYEISREPVDVVSVTGAKPFYYSTDRRAAGFGYAPRYTSLEGISREISAIMEKR